MPAFDEAQYGSCSGSGIMAAIRYTLLAPSVRAIRLGLYSIWSSTETTFLRASSDTLPLLCKTRSTVPTDTPASRAISLIRMFLVFITTQLGFWVKTMQKNAGFQ